MPWYEVRAAFSGLRALTYLVWSGRTNKSTSTTLKATKSENKDLFRLLNTLLLSVLSWLFLILSLKTLDFLFSCWCHKSVYMCSSFTKNKLLWSQHGFISCSHLWHESDWRYWWRRWTFASVELLSVTLRPHLSGLITSGSWSSVYLFINLEKEEDKGAGGRSKGRTLS